MSIATPHDDDKVPEPFLTGEQCASSLGSSLFTFRRWVKRYKIPVHKNGPKSVRYLWSEVLDALAKNGLNGPRPKQPPQTTEGQPPPQTPEGQP